MTDLDYPACQHVYRKRTLYSATKQYPAIISSPFKNTYRNNNRSDHDGGNNNRIIQYHVVRRYRSVIASILMTVLFLKRWDVSQSVTAFTASSFLSLNYHQRTMIPKSSAFAATTAENAEMGYRRRSSNNDDDSKNNNDEEIDAFFTKSWKEVPGGFVPQFGMNQHQLQQTPPSTTTSKISNAAVQPPKNIIQSHPPSSSPLSISSKIPGSSTTSPMKKNTTPTTMRIRQLSSIKDYKHYVVDDVDPCVTTITVVRFYAPWCRACQAIQQRYYRLAQQYEQRSMTNLLPSPSRQFEEESATKTDSISSVSASSSSSSTTTPKMDVVVRFMECPVTKDNAILHQGLGVPSLPYGHIYHSKVGLVEEMKLNKNVFANFETTLASYVNGYCTVNYDKEDEERRTDPAAVTSNNSVDPSSTSFTFR